MKENWRHRIKQETKSDNASETANLFRDLYTECQVRGSDLSYFLSGKMWLVSIIVQVWKLCYGQKCYFVAYVQWTKYWARHSTWDWNCCYGLCSMDLRDSKQLKEYISHKVIKPLLDTKSLRCNILCDVYSENWLKGEERDWWWQ